MRYSVSVDQHPARRERGRGKATESYLPQDDLARFKVATLTEPSEALRELLAFEAGRARQYYREAAPLVAMIHARSRPSLRALIGIYSRLLDRIVASDYDVLARRIRVPAWEKIWILVARSRLG